MARRLHFWRGTRWASLIALCLAWPLSKTDTAYEWLGFTVGSHRGHWSVELGDQRDLMDDRGALFIAKDGVLMAFLMQDTASPRSVVPRHHHYLSTDQFYDTRHWLGDPFSGPGLGTFSFGDDDSALWTRYTGTMLPLWPVSLIGTAALAASATRWARRARRTEGNPCTTCGYDLRAHKPGEKCPECGTVSLSERRSAPKH